MPDMTGRACASRNVCLPTRVALAPRTCAPMLHSRHARHPSSAGSQHTNISSWFSHGFWLLLHDGDSQTTCRTHLEEATLPSTLLLQPYLFDARKDVPEFIISFSLVLCCWRMCALDNNMCVSVTEPLADGCTILLQSGNECSCLAGFNVSVCYNMNDQPIKQHVIIA